MSIVAEQIIVGQAPELEPVGFRAGWHESPQDAWMPDDSRWPGNQPQDPEELDVNVQAACRAERDRLRKLVPGASVNVRKEVGSFDSEFGESDYAEWIVIVGVGKVQGSCRADVATTTLRDACDAALVDYAAKALDSVTSRAGEMVGAA